MTVASDEFAREYALSLQEDLTCNSKVVINNLTTLAGENRMAAQAIVQEIEKHLISCTAQQKVPALYLLDSLVKNVGDPYRSLIWQRIPKLFQNVWMSVAPSSRKDLVKLFVTWHTIFPSAVLAAIDQKMRQINLPNAVQATAPHPASQPIPIPNGHASGGNQKGNGYHHKAQSAHANGGVSLNSKTGKVAVNGGDEGATVDVSTLVNLLLKSAEQAKVAGRKSGVTVFDAKELTAAVIKEDDGRVLEALQEGSKNARPKFLDWRFQIRRDRRKKTYKTRRWYAPPERWVEESDPVDLSPLDLVKKLTEPKEVKPEKHIVLIDDDNPQTHCAISGDKLEKYFDPELEDWYYKDCRRVHGEEASLNNVPEGSIVITSCLKKPESAFRGRVLGVRPISALVRGNNVSRELSQAATGTSGAVVGGKRKVGQALGGLDLGNEQHTEKKLKDEKEQKPKIEGQPGMSLAF